MKFRTKKQELYLKEVIRLHREKGYGEARISRILPIGHATVSRWIATFARENKVKFVRVSKSKKQQKKQTLPACSAPQVSEGKHLQAEVSRLQAELKHEKLRADAYEEMIRVAELKFNISIRKKAGAK
jgi:transposase